MEQLSYFGFFNVFSFKIFQNMSMFSNNLNLLSNDLMIKSFANKLIYIKNDKLNLTLPKEQI